MRLAHLSLLLLLAVETASSQMISVSSSGRINTLAAARDAARAERVSGKTGPITITIHAGTYYLPETLQLGPEDSDTIWVAAPGEHPVISGGRPISGWVKTPSGVWTAKAPGPYFHQLFVNGRRAVRSRLPATGYFRMDGIIDPKVSFRLHFHGNDLNRKWADLGDVEVVGYTAWSDFRLPIVSVDDTAKLAILGSDKGIVREDNARYIVENAPDALNTPGEWYLNRSTSTVSYIPLPGENVGQSQFVAAGLGQLVNIQGNVDSGAVVHDVVLRGLTFAHADWNMGPKGYIDTQAGLGASAAISAVGVVKFRMERCTITHSGGYALELGRGSKHNEVLSNEFYDLGAGGLKLGEATQGANDLQMNYGNLVSDNNIHDLGLVYAGGVGIWILQSGQNQVIHNHVHDLYYTGISVGWTWGYTPNQTGGNLIAFNNVHDVGKKMLSDMGGIYTLGVQPGTVIENNLIHDVSSFNYGGYGIYLDEGSSSILVENNIVYGCDSAGFYQHYGQDNEVRNNIFAFSRDHQLVGMRPEAHNTFTFEKNIVYFNNGDLLGGDWTAAHFIMRRNLFYDKRGTDIHFGKMSFSDWQAFGQDSGSRLQNPGFRDPDNFDFRLQPQSPALSMGFHEIDMSTVGPRYPTGAANL